MCEYTVPSIHIVVDQRSEDGWIHRRSLTSQPIKGETFPDFEMLDARIASALRKIIPNSNFPRRVSVEDQRGSETRQILRGRQMAYVINDTFE